MASTFRVGSVLLAGDAAPLQPPFFGQGMNSGLRDAGNLARLPAIVRDIAGPELIATYDSERRPHATEMVRFATKMGSMYRPRNAGTERLRDLVFQGVQVVPGGRDYVLQMKYKPMPRYLSGVVTGADPNDRHDPVGRMFIQPDVAVQGNRVRLDDAIGPWFAVLCVGDDPSTFDDETVAWWRSIGATLIEVTPCGAAPSTVDDDNVVTLEDMTGAFGEWCRKHPNRDVIVLRPDRYVAAACMRINFAAATTALRSTLAAPKTSRSG